MTRGGSKQRQIGERRCLIEGKGAERSALIRFVLSSENVVTADVLERLDGRGVWVSAKRSALDEAVAKNAFAKGFKTKALIPEDLIGVIEAQLTARLVSLLGIARKAGEAIAGAEKVAQALQMGEARLILQASDGSEREKRNLSYKNSAEYRFECLNRRELGMAFARENVVHAATTGEALTNRVRDEAIRLSLLRETQYYEDQTAN